MRVAAALTRLFYGWYIAMAVAGTAFIAWGIGFYQLGVFVHAFHDERGWSLGALSVGPTIFYLLVGLTNLVAGRVIDRYGPRALRACCHPIAAGPSGTRGLVTEHIHGLTPDLP